MSKISFYEVLRRRLKSRGFTLLELTIVLLVAGVLIGAVWVAAAHVWDNYRTARTAQQLTKITQNIREYYMNGQKLTSAPGVTAAAGTDITAYLDTLTLFPLEMRRNPSGGAGGSIDYLLNNSVAGGSFHVLSENCPSGAASACFRISLQGLATGACIRLLKAVPVNDADLGILKVGVANMGTSTTVVSSPLNPSTLETWCNQAGANNEVDWDFKLRD